MAYTKEEWENENKYLDDLIKNGNAGEQAWAKNQKKALSGVFDISEQTPSTTPLTNTTTPTQNSPTTQWQYNIGSDIGKGVAAALAAGQTYQASDGSVWLKKNDGSVSVNYKGQVTENAYTPETPAPVVTTPTTTVPPAITAPVVTAPTVDPSITSEDILNWNENYNTNNAQPTAPTQDPRIAELLDKILNREDFSYDVASDPMYQQYANMYNREGNRAMRETMAEAAGFAGGMNSYAMTAAQQAQDYYSSQLNDRIPELYQLAYQMYLQDKESQVQDLGLLQQMDETQYSRYRDTMSDWRNDKNFAYGAFQDAIGQDNFLTNLNNSNYWNAAEMNNNNFWNAADMNNSNYWNGVAQDNWNKTFENDNYWNGVAQDNWDKTFENNNYWNGVTQGNTEQAAAREEVWKLIDLGVTPSADLIAKAGMSQADIDLAVAAVIAGGTGTSGGNENNGYTGDTGDTGDISPNTEPTISIADIENDLNGYIERGATKSEINAYLRSALQEGIITQAQYKELKETYAPQGHLY